MPVDKTKKMWYHLKSSIYCSGTGRVCFPIGCTAADPQSGTRKRQPGIIRHFCIFIIINNKKVQNMGYQDKQQAQDPKQDNRVRPEGRQTAGQRSFDVPNSLMWDVPVTPAGTPNSVMREPGPVNRGGLFKSRGYDPAVGAHELSHIVRREPVRSPGSRSVPDGTIQRFPPERKGGGNSMEEMARKHPELFLTSQPPARPAAAAAAAAADESEPEAEDPEVLEMEEAISRGQGRSSFLIGVFQGREYRDTMNKLSEKISGEQDPEKLQRLQDFQRELGTAPDEVRRVNAAFREAEGRLDAGHSVSAIRADYFDAPDSPYHKMMDLVRLNNAMARFRFCAEHPNIPFYFDDEDEMDSMMSGFETVPGGLRMEDFEILEKGTPGGDYDEEVPDENGSNGTPGYDAPPAEPEQPGLFRRFVNFVTRKNKKDEKKK